jgi:hypothetical protein
MRTKSKTSCPKEQEHILLFEVRDGGPQQGPVQQRMGLKGQPVIPPKAQPGKQLLVEDATSTGAGIYAGQKSSKKVKEILQNGFLERTAAMEGDAEAVAFRDFCLVWGVGPKRAQEWLDRGFRALDDVRNSPECMAELSSRERTGMKYHDDFKIRIPREVRHMTRIFLMCVRIGPLHGCALLLLLVCWGCSKTGLKGV